VQAFAGPGTSGGTTHPDIKEYSFFVQDEWRLSTEFTFNAGLRYDLQKFASPQVRNPDPQLAAASIDTSVLPTDANNWGPRLGFAWIPAGKKSLVRGGYGLFYGRTPSIMVGTAHSNNGINVQTITFTGAQIPAYPTVFTALPTGVALPRPTIFNFDRNYQNPWVEQASVGYEYQLMADTALVINYLHVHGHQLPRSTDINVGAASTPVIYTVAGTGQQLTYDRFAAGPFTNFGRIISFQSTAESRYDGLTVEFNRRFARHVSARAAYTLGKVTDTVPDATAVVPGSSTDDAKYASNPKNFEVDRTVGNNDQRHRFVFSAIYDTNGLAAGKSGVAAALARGWNVSAIYTAATGQPFSARVGNVDLNNDGNTRNDFAPGTVRNQFNLPNYYALDLRLARDIRFAGVNVQPIFEAFNLLNADNINSVNQALYGVNTTTSVLTPGTSFGQALGTAGQRIMQVALRLMF
jgi:hypothetical protein